MEPKEQKPEQENPTTQSVGEEQKAEGPSSASRLSRRRALITGLAAAPVVLSLMNRSAWGASASCALVASYVNAGYKWQSPRPSNGNGTLTFSNGNYQSCGLSGPPS